MNWFWCNLLCVLILERPDITVIIDCALQIVIYLVLVLPESKLVLALPFVCFNLGTLAVNFVSDFKKLISLPPRLFFRHIGKGLYCRPKTEMSKQLTDHTKV